MKSLVSVASVLLFVSTLTCGLGKSQEHATGCIQNNSSDIPDNPNHQDHQLIYDHEGNWRLKYIDEQVAGFKVIVEEQSIDQKLSNVIHTTSSVRMVDWGIHTFASGDPEEDEANLQVAGSSPAVDDELCGQHLTQMLDQMDELSERLQKKRSEPQAALNLTEKDYRLARVLDSFGRYEPGHLLGNTHAAGSFEECVGSKLLLAASPVENQPKLVKSRYCWAKFSVDRHLHPTLRTRKLHQFDAKQSFLSAGICIPETCHSKSFRKHPHLFAAIANSQFKLPQSIYLDQDLQLDSVYCLMDSDSSFGVPLSGQLWFWFVGLWTMLVLYCTFFATLDDNNGGLFAHIATCLDLKRNWADFVESNRDMNTNTEAKVNFDALNTLKALATMYVVFGHSFVFKMAGSTNVLHNYLQIENDPLGLLIQVGTVVIDSFLLITGMLLAYSSLSRESTDEPFRWSAFLRKWSRLALGRYLRLLPLYYLVFWFTKGVLIYLNGHLPLWDCGFNRETMMGACKQEPWLGPLISLSGYLPITRQCMSQTWTVAADLQFALILTPIMLLFARRPHLATVISLGLCLFSVGWSYRLFFELEPTIIAELSEVRMQGVARMFSHVGYMYTMPHLRFSSILVGYIVGYHLAGYRRKDQTDWPWWVRGPATQVSLSIVLLVFTLWPQMPAVKRLADPHHKTMFLHVLSSFRLVWSLANGVLLMRLVSDWKMKPLTLLSSPGATRFFRILVKLSYPILLVHMNLLLLDLGRQTSLGNYSTHKVATSFSLAYLLSVPLSVALHLLFEDPLDKLAKRLVLPAIYGRPSQRQQTPKEKRQ